MRYLKSNIITRLFFALALATFAAQSARADFIRAVGREAGDSRIWAGIHFEMDNQAGKQLGKSVAGVFISRAQEDGSQ